MEERILALPPIQRCEITRGILEMSYARAAERVVVVLCLHTTLHLHDPAAASRANSPLRRQPFALSRPMPTTERTLPIETTGYLRTRPSKAGAYMNRLALGVGSEVDPLPHEHHCSVIDRGEIKHRSDLTYKSANHSGRDS